MFSLLMLFLCVILHTMSSGKSLQLLCIFLFGMLCLSAISMMFVNILLAVCILVGTVVRQPNPLFGLNPEILCKVFLLIDFGSLGCTLSESAGCTPCNVERFEKFKNGCRFR